MTVSIAIAAGGLAASCADSPPPADDGPQYRPVASNLELMESIVAHAAEVYWESVMIVVDETGVTEHYPETDEQWEEVWSAGVSLAESGNLLMMPPRALDDGRWMRFSDDLVSVGVEAAEAALARDPEAVLDAGERIYTVCLDCHEVYAPDLSRVQ